MKYSDFAIRHLKDRLLEKAQRKTTPLKIAGDMLEAAEVISQLEKKCVKWIPTAERLPKESRNYLCIPKNDFYVADLPFSAEHQAFNVYDEYSYDSVTRLAITVSYWAERPELPEEPKV